MSKGKTIALWVLSCLVAALFLFAGGMKLLKADEVKPMFVQYGYAAWFATFIGVCEVLGGLGLLIPRLAGVAAACLSIIMVGAVYTVASHQQYSQAIIPLVTLVALIFISYSRFKTPKGVKAEPALQGR